MGTKSNPAANDCYNNAMPDEPLFTLLARDVHAPEVIRYWAQMRADDIDCGLFPKSDQSKVEEALACARSMEEWHAIHKDRDGKWIAPAPLLESLENAKG